MKTITILSAILILAGHFLVASALEPTPGGNHPDALVLLAPTIPAEADFSGIVPECNYSTLAPALPAEATFEEDPVAPDLSGFAPLLPQVADFLE